MDMRIASQDFAMAPMMPAAHPAFRVQGVVLHHLQLPAEINQILCLREEIDLSVHTVKSNFESLEKKETKSVWSSDLSLKGSGLALFA